MHGASVSSMLAHVLRTAPVANLGLLMLAQE